MSELGLVEYFSMAEALGIIATMLIVLYFSRKQTQALSVDIETKVLNDLDEKMQGLAQMAIETRVNKDTKQCSIGLVSWNSIHLSYSKHFCTCISYAPKKGIKRQWVDRMVAMDEERFWTRQDKGILGKQSRSRKMVWSCFRRIH